MPETVTDMRLEALKVAVETRSWKQIHPIIAPLMTLPNLQPANPQFEDRWKWLIGPYIITLDVEVQTNNCGYVHVTLTHGHEEAPRWYWGPERRAEHERWCNHRFARQHPWVQGHRFATAGLTHQLAQWAREQMEEDRDAAARAV